MKPDELFNIGALAAAVAAVTDVSVPPWVWVLLAAALIVVVIVAVRRAPSMGPSDEETASDFAELVAIGRRTHPELDRRVGERRKETS